MKLKVHNGTRSGESLCHTCVNAHIRRGSALGQEVVRCHRSSYENPDRIIYPIVECGDYSNKNLPSLRDMTQIAYFINSNQKTGKIGFTSPDQDRNDKVERETPDSPFD